MKILGMGQLGGLSPQGSIAIGVLVGLISTSLQAIGLTLQRKSHLLEDEKYSYDFRRPPYKRKRWQLGMFMFVLSNIVGSSIQLTTLPLPVLSTLQASGLVFNTLFATLILGEAFTRYSFMGTVLVCIGAVMIGIFGAIGEPAHSLDQLLSLLWQPAFLKWMAGTAVIVAVTILGVRILKILSAPSRTRLWGWASKYTLSSFHTPRVKAIRGLLFGSVSGILSAHSLLVAKSAVELLVRTIIDRVNQFNRWQSWVIVLGLVALALSQLYYMHRGLKLCSTSILYPFVFCVYNIIAILDGLIYFRQASEMPALHAGLIALGTVILLSGVLCLSWRLEETAPVGPPPAPLTPGLGIMDEEHARSSSFPEFLDADDEESQQQQQQQQQRLAGERQPLLLCTQQDVTPTPSHRYTLPRLFPLHRRRNTTPRNEAAEIWAELADDDETTTTLRDAGTSSPPTPSSPLLRFHKRLTPQNRTMSTPSSSKPNNANVNKPVRSPTIIGAKTTTTTPPKDREDQLSPLPVNGHHDKSGGTLTAAGAKERTTWARRSARFLPHFQGGKGQSRRSGYGWRRTSAPPIAGMRREQGGQMDGDVSTPDANDVTAADDVGSPGGTLGDHNESSRTEGPEGEEPEHQQQGHHQQQQQEQSTSNSVGGVWNAGRRWIRRWMKQDSSEEENR